MLLDENDFCMYSEIHGKKFSFICAKETTLGEIFDALCQMKVHIVNAIQNHDKPKELSSEHQEAVDGSQQ